MKTDEEKALIDKARNGDVSAFESLYRMHSARVHGLCVRLCDSQADAQDATQETFVKAWRALGSFQGRSAFSTWLHRIAFNESMSLKRGRAGKERHLQLVEQPGKDDAESLTEMEQLERAVTKLPERAREALLLNKVYGYTHKETAEFMGTTIGASKAQVHRAMQLLRSLLPGTDSASDEVPATGNAINDE